MLNNLIVCLLLLTPPADKPARQYIFDPDEDRQAERQAQWDVQHGFIPDEKQAPPSVPVPKPDVAPVPKPPAKATTPFVTLPVAIEGKVGEYIYIKPITHEGCKAVEYVPMTEGLNVFPADALKDSRNTVVSSPVAGRFKLLAYTAAGSVPSRPTVTEIIIGGAPPTPPGPGPGPGPAPPVPVRPTGLAGEIYDKMVDLPKPDILKIDGILKGRLDALTNGVGNKATIIADIVKDIKAATLLSKTEWTTMVDWLRLRMIQQWPDATDDQVVEGMKTWKIATSAIVIKQWMQEATR